MIYRKRRDMKLILIGKNDASVSDDNYTIYALYI